MAPHNASLRVSNASVMIYHHTGPRGKARTNRRRVYHGAKRTSRVSGCCWWPGSVVAISWSYAVQNLTCLEELAGLIWLRIKKRPRRLLQLMHSRSHCKEVVSECAYLGSRLSTIDGTEEDVNAWLGKQGSFQSRRKCMEIKNLYQFSWREENGNGWAIHCEKWKHIYMYTKSLRNESQMDIARREDPRTHGEETWSKKYRTSVWTGVRWKLLYKTDKDGDVWSVTSAPVRVKRLK